MKKVCGIGFKEVGKIYWFEAKGVNVKVGDYVVVETVRGQELGHVIKPIGEVDESKIEHELKSIIRVATKKDINNYLDNAEYAELALKRAKEIIADHNLEMKTVGCEYTLDGTKLLIYYTADGRVDFRELVKDLASEFKVRIELRQIGPREGAKIIGGLGFCGREICCKQHLRDFDLVTMKMAKDQGMSLSSSKITGLCGKLMCCIAYEQSIYAELKEKLPSVGDLVKTPNCESCKVTAVNYLMETVTTVNDEATEVWEAAKVECIKKAKQKRDENLDKDDLSDEVKED